MFAEYASQSSVHASCYLPCAAHLHPHAPVNLRSLAKAVSFCIFLCYEATAEVICRFIEITAFLFTQYILITIFILDIAFLFPALSSFPSPLGSPSIRTIAFPTNHFSISSSSRPRASGLYMRSGYTPSNPEISSLLSLNTKSPERLHASVPSTAFPRKESRMPHSRLPDTFSALVSKLKELTVDFRTSPCPLAELELCASVV